MRCDRWSGTLAEMLLSVNSQDSLRAPLCSSCLREKRGRYLSAKGERREAKRERREESHTDFFLLPSPCCLIHQAWKESTRGLVTGRDQDSEKSIKYYMWSMVVLLTNSFLEATLIVPSSAAQTYQQRCLRLHNHSN
eukprot:scaffold10833_cov114-Skeletonema_marinoi.AAC.7